MKRSLPVLAIFSFVLASCELKEVKLGTELEGSWQSICFLGFRSISTFTGSNYKLELASHNDLSCASEKSRATLNAGTFTIGPAVASTPGAKELDMVTTTAGAKSIYTMYKLDGNNVYFDAQGTAPNDGATAATRINVISMTASTVQTKK